MSEKYYKDRGDPILEDLLRKADPKVKTFLTEARDYTNSMYSSSLTMFLQELSYDEYATLPFWEKAQASNQTAEQVIDDIFYEGNQITRQRKFAGNFY